MSEQRISARIRRDSPWVIDAKVISRQPGSHRAYQMTVPAPAGFGDVDVIGVPEGSDVQLDLLVESVMEGMYVSGTVAAKTVGMCSRCLEPLADEVAANPAEMFAFPGSLTEATTDADEVSRLVDDTIDLEPMVRDAVVLALPSVPLCTPDCAGLCQECGAKWVDVGPEHQHEKIDPRWAALKERFSGTMKEI